MINLHYTDTFLSKISKEQHQNLVEGKLKELSLRNRNNIRDMNSITPFKNSMYALRMESPKIRVVLEETTIDIEDNSICVFIVHDIIGGQKFDYHWSRVNHPALKRGEWNNKFYSKEKEYEKFTTEFLRKKNIEEQIKPLLPNELSGWLNDYEFNIKYDVFESESWVRFALNTNAKEGMLQTDIRVFKLLLERIINEEEKLKTSSIKNNGRTIHIAIDYELGILYEKLQLHNGHTIWLLHNGANLSNQKEHWENQITNIRIKALNYRNKLEDISRFAFRAYPKWTLKDDSLWGAIQKNDERSNLSLLPEQIEFLLGFNLPTYINGQAGSGKSTMLYYLFANAYWYKCHGQISGDFIFLTENINLLNISKNGVFDLLNNNSEFNGLTDEDKGSVDHFFCSFRDFLTNLLYDEDKQLFPKSKYLDFSKFKTLYEESPLKKSIKSKYSAEVSWFAIRTYIYGYKIDEKITSQNYELLVDRDSRVLPKEVLKGIENYVLPYYEKLINEKGYWDKLKIIKHINLTGLDFKKYTLVVCDEAQDFCKVELKFILHLSEYVKYNLSEVSGVPIIFAGDPNQTVNPTGFREAEITSMMYEELSEIAEYSFDKNKNISYNPSYNYRSSHPVVGLANFIQFYRKKVLGISIKKPQEAKRPEPVKDYGFNPFFSYEDIKTNSSLKSTLEDKIKHKIFIVPVDTEDKEIYIKKIESLVNVNNLEIKTSVEAKGAEYEQVVLFGFGDYYMNEYGDLEYKKEQDDNLAFQKRFFFNKFYVGVTRAQTELIIIDSEGSEDKFWNKLTAEITEVGEGWESLKKDIIQYHPDTLDSVIESTREVGLENAEKDEKQGEYDKNAARLKAAANQYFKLGYKDKYFSCLAKACEFREEWRKAASYYQHKDLSEPNLKDAARCYWQGQLFQLLLDEIGTNTRTVKQDVRLALSRIMLDKKVSNSEIQVLYEHRSLINELLYDLSWRNDLIDNIILSIQKFKDKESLRDFVKVLETIVLDHDIGLRKLIANIHFDTKQFEKAINFWDSLDYIDHFKYAQAQVEVAEAQNDRIRTIGWYGKMTDYFESKEEKNHIENKIIEIFKKIENSTYPSKDIGFYRYIYQAYLVQIPEKLPFIIAERFEAMHEKKPHKLRLFYQQLLVNRKLDRSILEYTLERWAKSYFFENINRIDKGWLIELNDEYRKIANNPEIYFYAFTIDELNQIPTTPKIQSTIISEFIDEIRIREFRKFRDIELSNLGQFNLLVGDNNTGKTSLLEGLLFNPDIKEYAKNLAFVYNERLNSNPKFVFNARFVNDFINRSTDKKVITFNIRQKRKTWKYSIKYPTKQDIIEKMEIRDSAIDIKDYLSIASMNNNQIVDIPLLLKRLREERYVSIPFVPFGKGHGADLAQLYYDEIDKKRDLRKRFIQNMKVFIPQIDRISTDTENGEITIEEVLHDGTEVTAPLHQYGEGANKLFRILVQITIHANKRLMIDEIDAGIHYSRFKIFWRTVLKVAQRHNVQLFASTHNIECIDYFMAVLKESDMKTYKEKARVIQLDQFFNNKIVATTYNFEDIEYAYNSHQEIRGGGNNE